jgi:hypothetical protein
VSSHLTILNCSSASQAVEDATQRSISDVTGFWESSSTYSKAKNEEDHRAGNMDMFRNRRYRKIYNVLVVKRPFLYIDPTSSP